MSLGEFLQKTLIFSMVFLLSYLMFALIYWDLLWIPLMDMAGRVIWIIVTTIIAGLTAEELELDFDNGT